METLKMKASTLTLLSLTCLFTLLNTCLCQTYTHTLIVEIDTSKTYASNTLYKWSVRISPTPTIITTVIFRFSWLERPIENFTDVNGRAYVYVKTPLTVQGKTHTITIENPQGLFAPRTLTINTEIGIYPKLTYYSKQFYNPEGIEDIVLYVEPVDTDYGSTVPVTSWSVIAFSPTGSTLKGQVQPTNIAGKYKLYFSTDVVGTYNVKVELSYVHPSGITYVSVPNTAEIVLGTPKILVKVKCGTSEAWVVRQPSGERFTNSSIFIPKGTTEFYVEIYNSHLQPLTPDYYDFIVNNQYYYSKRTLYVERKASNVFVIYFELVEATYDFTVIVQRGMYDRFEETIKINTEVAGWKWTEWLLNPYFMLAFIIIGLLIINSLRKKRKGAGEK